MTTEIITSSIFTIIITFIALYTVCDLFKNRKEFPYANISPIWIIATLISVSLSQLLSLLNFAIHFDIKFIDNRNDIITTGEPKQPMLFFILFNLLIIHHLTIIPLMVRTFSIGQSLKFNYYYLKRNLNDINSQIQAELNFRSRYFSRNFYSFKLFIIPLIAILFLIIVFLGITYTRCALYSVAYSFNGFQQQECEGLEDEDLETVHMVGDVMVNLVIAIEASCFFTLIILIFRYPIKQDKFYLRLEFVIVFIIWIASHNIELGIFYMVHLDISSFSLFLSDSACNTTIIALYACMTYLRKKTVINKDFTELFNDFPSFMNCHVTFQLFKDYIRRRHEEHYKLLLFWAEFVIFKQRAEQFKDKIQETEVNRTKQMSSNSLQVGEQSILSQDEKLITHFYNEELKDMSEGIFQDYFTFNKFDSNPSRSSHAMAIDFPIDIYEKVEDCARRNFAIDHLDFVFDESFVWVKERLMKIFSEFRENEEEKEKLGRILFFWDFYDINVGTEIIN